MTVLWASTILLHGFISAAGLQLLAPCGEWIKRSAAVAASLVGLCLACLMWYHYVPSPGFHFVEQYQWISTLGASYHLGVDGISMMLILLTFVIVFIAIIVVCLEGKDLSTECSLIFLIQATTVGSFCALDGLLFYLFWEASLLPMFFYIGGFGGKERWHASKKYFIFTLAGSLFFLISILYLGFRCGDFSFLSFYDLDLNLWEQKVLFVAFTLAFAIKLPMFPFHSWLPDAHTQASTSGSMLLAAILLKLGGYGFLRFNLPITPDASQYFALAMVVLSLIAIIYIGFVALVQQDIKRLIAYASISHMGMVTLGLFVVYLLPNSIMKDSGLLGLTGVVVHMISHGFSSAGLFLGFGLLYRRMGTRALKDFGGLMGSMPVLSCCFFLFILSNIGFPGTGGFVGEFMVILSSLAAHFWIALLAVSTMLLSAGYSLYLVRNVFYGKVSDSQSLSLVDVSFIEKVPLFIFVALIFTIGLYPNAIVRTSEESLRGLVLDATRYKVGQR